MVGSLNIEDKQKMLESSEWQKINKSCYAFVVAETGRVIATVYTAYDPEEDGDEIPIWNADIEDDSIGSYIGLYCAQQAVQTIFCALEQDEEAAKMKKKATVKVKAKLKNETANS